MKLKEYIDEIILIVLKKTMFQIEEFKKIGDISGEEILNSKVIVPYEKIYTSLDKQNIEELSEEEREKIKEIASELREKNNLSEDEIENSFNLREKLKGNSGSEVVKRFFKYKLNRLLESKEKIIESYEKLNLEEQKYENELKDSIQEQEQFDIIYKLHPIRKRLREYEIKFQELTKEIEVLQKKLDTKWSYEIYGTVEEKELLKSYKEVFGMEGTDE